MFIPCISQTVEIFNWEKLLPCGHNFYLVVVAHASLHVQPETKSVLNNEKQNGPSDFYVMLHPSSQDGCAPKNIRPKKVV